MQREKLVEKSNRIRQKALDLGFDNFGISGPDPGEAIEHFQKWLQQGYDGEMAYMGRWQEKRADMNRVLDGVKSVICLSTNYLTADKTMDFVQQRQVGDISLYALNEDYHDLIKDRLKDLDKIIHEEFPRCQTKVYVDTGPILEKPLAENAGIGWIGKHTNLLSEHIGSWYFLSEILVDVELPRSEPAVNRCGTCRDCIDICPTQAIVAPYVLDSRKCISYLTIELKGVIPLEFRKAIGNRIYGCDDCQIVCPWNSYAVKTEEPAFMELGGTRLLIDLIQLDAEGFRSRFRNSPIKRTKRRGLLRNVAVALGNSADPKAVDPLIAVLADEEPLIRAHAVWALGELLGKSCLEVFQQFLAEEKAEMVLHEVQELQKRFVEN